MPQKRSIYTFVVALLGIGLTMGAAVLLDAAFGRLSGLNAVRESARLFRSEAAYVQTRTMAMRPGIAHRFEPLEPGDVEVRHFRTNALGGIIGSTDVDPAAQTILFLGGSTTESNEVSEDRRFPFVVQTLLRDAGADVRVINAGVRGHTTHDSLIAYLSRPGFREANIVVLMHNINDRLWLAKFPDYSVPLPASAPTELESVQDTTRSLFFSVWDFVSYRSNVLFAVRQRLTYFNPWTGEANLEGVVTEHTVDQKHNLILSKVDEFEANIRTFSAIVRANNAIPIVMTQPLGRPSEGQAIFNDAIRRIASEQGIVLIDLSAALGDDKPWVFLSDGIHLSDLGSESVGKAVAESLSRLVNVTVRSSDKVSIFAERCPAQPTGNTVRPGEPFPIMGIRGRYPSFSKDGAWMIYQAHRSGFDRLMAIRTETGRVVELTPPSTSVNERHPTILSASDDSLEVVFGSGFDPNGHGLERLYIRQWPSLETRPLISDPEVGGAIPAVSNRLVVFPTFKQTADRYTPDLVAFDLDTQSISRLTQTPYEEWRPAVSSNGTIFHIGNAKGDFDIMALQPGASHSVEVFRSPEDEWDPAVSPNDRWLVFATKRTGTWDLMLMNPDEKGSVAPLTSDTNDDWDPAFHPSGRLVVFARSFGAEPSIYGVCLFSD